VNSRYVLGRFALLVEFDGTEAASLELYVERNNGRSLFSATEFRGHYTQF
jgi:hypothetical protein